MNSDITATLIKDPALDDSFVDLTELQDVFGVGFKRDDNNFQTESVRDSSQLSPIILIISTAISAGVALGIQKIIELFAEDIYTSTKKIVGGLFKKKSKKRREIRVELKSQPLIQGRVSSSDPELIEKALSKDGISSFVNLAMGILDKKKIPVRMIAFDISAKRELILNINDKLPEDTQWILIQYDENTFTWRVKTLKRKNGKIYISE